MDFKEQACHIIKNLYLYQTNEYDYSKLVLDICSFFDFASKQELGESDYHFLQLLSSKIGIPHYYDLLNRLKGHEDKDVDWSYISSCINDSPLFLNDESTLHKCQKEFIDYYSLEQENRFLLTAPTSFGKTFMVYEIIRKMAYKNVLLVFPTIALMVENYQKLIDLKETDEFWKRYSLHTLSDDQETSDYNIWAFTPERFLSFIDKNQSQVFDFSFMDEIYKIDNFFIIDIETIGENERDVAFRVALHYLCATTKDLLLVGPYLSLPSGQQNQSFNLFLFKNRIKTADYNNIEIVEQIHYALGKGSNINFNGNKLTITTIDRKKNLCRLLPVLKNEETIVYCSKKVTTESIAKELLKRNVFSIVSNNRLDVFINHLSARFPSNWIVTKSLKHGIGIHHGLVPKYVQKEIISLFNDGIIACILSTTTITEGVNTSAKNIIVTDSKKGSKDLKHFDAKNIAGRAGRFTRHFSGRVISLTNDFESILNAQDDHLKHVDYDLNRTKNDADLEICDEKYLNDADKERKRMIEQRVAESNLPGFVLKNFKTISKLKKVEMYETITQSSEQTINSIIRMCIVFANSNNLDKDGFQKVCDLIVNYVDEEGFKALFTNKSGDYSIITCLVKSYLSGGFNSMVKYNINELGKSADTAMRDTAKYVYNTFRYQLVKYLGLFDVLFKYYLSQKTNKPYDEVIGLNKLIKRIENGYISKKANIANDYGVPFALLDYYEGKTKNTNGFDEYEKIVFNAVEKLMDN